MNPINPSPKLSNEEIDFIYNKINETIGQPSKENIMLLCALLINEVKDLDSLNGNEKRELVKYFLYKLVEKRTPNEFDEFDVLIKTVVNNAIDTLIDVTKGKINLKKSSKFLFTKQFLGGMLQCFGNCLKDKSQIETKYKSGSEPKA